MAQSRSKNSSLTNLKKINKFAQMLRDARFRQLVIKNKKRYTRKNKKEEYDY
tara:strand:+ start:15 stop:170 length:156 start_codon:yes stop_codon:yes gene_type:complete